MLACFAKTQKIRTGRDFHIGSFLLDCPAGSPQAVWTAHFSVVNILYGYGSIPMKIPFLMGWTSINPSYFDVNYRGTRFWPIPIFYIRCKLGQQKDTLRSLFRIDLQTCWLAEEVIRISWNGLNMSKIMDVYPWLISEPNVEMVWTCLNK